MKRLLVVLLSVFLSACGVVSPSVSTLPEGFVPKPAATWTSVPSPVPSEAPSAIPAPAAVDPNFFRDDFVGNLDPQWTWIREDPQNWSLTALPGFLQINVQAGYVVANTSSNLLLRPAPAGNFQIETQLDFRPESNFQFAGLIIYESYSSFIQAGRGYCRSSRCIGSGLYMDSYINGMAIQPDFGQSYKDSGPILLRLSRQGDSYTFQASADGKTWFVIGSHTSDIKPLQIGLIAGQKVKGAVLPAAFDYFEVRSLP